MNLPGLNKYRSDFEAKGLVLPLPIVPATKQSAINELPPPPAGKTGWPWTEETHPSKYHANIAWPKLTVVTPSYNQDQFLEQTIRAVLLQNYPNLEFIIIDGGSNDNSVQIIKKYAPWLSYWQSEKDRGQSHAINLGFSLASGNYHSWINSDDYYTKGALHKVVSSFIEKKVDFIYGYGYNYLTLTNKLNLVKVAPFLDRFIRIPSLIQPSCFWSANIHQPLWEALHCSLDYELWQRLVKGHSRKLLKEPLSVANVHDDAKTHDPKMKIAWEHDHQLICSANAHGPVNNWDKMMVMYKIYLRIINIFC